MSEARLEGGDQRPKAPNCTGMWFSSHERLKTPRKSPLLQTGVLFLSAGIQNKKVGVEEAEREKKKKLDGKQEWKWVRQGNRIQFRLTHQLFITVCIPISCISKGRQRLCPQGPVICAQGQLAAAWFP